MKKWYILYAVGNLLLAASTFIPLDEIKTKQVMHFLFMFLASTWGLWKLHDKETKKQIQRNNNDRS